MVLSASVYVSLWTWFKLMRERGRAIRTVYSHKPLVFKEETEEGEEKKDLRHVHSPKQSTVACDPSLPSRPRVVRSSAKLVAHNGGH